jgi:hypothetical protein
LFGVSLRKEQGIDVMVAGQPLFQSYYIIMDFEGKKVALSGARTSISEDGGSDNGSAAGLIIGILSGIIILGGAYGYVMYKRKRRLSQSLAQYN